MSALSSAVSAWVAVSTRGELKREAGPPPDTELDPDEREAKGDGNPPTKAERTLSRKARNRTLALIFVSLVSAGACVAFLASALLDDGNTISDAPFLRAVIPPAFSKTCEPVDPPEGAIASMSCRPSRLVVSVRYTLYRGSEAMRRALASQAAELGLPIGDCEQNGFAQGQYGSRGEGNWGNLICFLDEAGARISWTNEDLRIVATALAAADKDDELYKWWEEEAGPLPTYNLKSFPSAAETRLLDWIPASHRRDCKRSSWGGPAAKASFCALRQAWRPLVTPATGTSPKCEMPTRAVLGSPPIATSHRAPVRGTPATAPTRSTTRSWGVWSATPAAEMPTTSGRMPTPQSPPTRNETTAT